MRSLPEEAQTLGAGGQSTYDALLKLDESWSKLRKGELPPPRDIVFDEPDAALETPEYDAVVCGGNIGILLATALVLKGLRVAVLEAGELRGREQDWNASRKEVDELVEAGVLTREEADEVIGIELAVVEPIPMSVEVSFMLLSRPSASTVLIGSVPALSPATRAVLALACSEACLKPAM